MKGKLTISRITSNRTDDSIQIDFIDDTSGITFASASMSPETFALAVTGLGHIDVELEVFGLKNVGKTREQKTERIVVEPITRSDENRYHELINKSTKYEIDGWVCALSSWQRITVIYDKHTGEYFVSVPFVRYV